MPSGAWAATATGSSARKTTFTPRAARAYRQLAEREPERFVVVDGTASSELLAEEIYGALRRNP